LRDQSTLWHSRSRQWEYSPADQPDRGYKNLRYLLLKAKRMAVMNLEFIAVCTLKKVA
jgi:hypothetical protein